MAIESYVVVPDCHVPFEDQDFIDVVCQAISFLKPTGVVQLGDAIDCWQISSYDKDPTRRMRLVDDIDCYNDLLDKFEGVMPKGSTFHQLCGNHEDRLRRYMWKQAGQIVELCKDWPELLRFEERNARRKVKWVWHPLANWRSCKLGDTVLHHGHYFDKNVAVSNLVRYRCNFIQGHTHRVQQAYDGRHFSVSLGHGSDAEKTAHTPTPHEWQQAFGVLDVDKGRGRFTLVPFDGACAMVRNKLLRVR